MEQPILRVTDYEYNYNAIKSLGAAFLFYAGSYSVKPIFRTLGLGKVESIGSLFFYIIWAIHIYRALCIGTKMKLSLFIKIVFWDLAFSFILYINKVLFPDTAQYYAEYMMFFRQIVLVFIPCGVLVSQIFDFSEAFIILRKYAWYGSLIMMVSFCCGYLNYWGYQYWGVQLSPFILILFANYSNNKRFGDLFLLLIDALLILLGGRQSFVVVVLACFALYIYDNRKKSIRMFIVSSLIVLVGLIFISGSYTLFFRWLNSVMDSFGLHMEALDRIASGKLFDTSTRNIYYVYSADIIHTNGSKVSGLLSDRYYLRNYGQYTSWMVYPHNIILELLIDFGTVLGTLISVLLLVSVIRNMFFLGDKYRKRMGIIICVLTMVRLFVSNSFIIEGDFYIMLGFLFGINKLNTKLR